MPTISNDQETVVFQSLTIGLAAVVCDELEKAGFTPCLEKVDGGFAVMVPADDAARSRGLLWGHPQKQEIFFL